MKNSHSLSVHISRYHNENNASAGEVICPVCERKYGNKYSLRTHMHLNHKDQLHLLGTSRRSNKADKKQETQQSGASGGGNAAKDESYYY